MNLFPEQISAAGARQLEAQLQFFRSAAGSALDGAEQLAALQFAATRGALEKSTELLRQVAAAKDPRDLLTLANHSHFQFDSMLAYQRKLFGIATAMSGSVIGLPGIVTPAASAALQKLAALPPVASTVASPVPSPVAEVTLIADRIIEDTHEVVEQLADDAAQALAPAAPAPVTPALVDDIIEQTNEVVETVAADAESVAAAPTVEAAVQAAAEPIAELTAVAAATGHQEPQPSAAPFTVGSSDTPIEVEQVDPVDAAPQVAVAKSGGRPRKK